MRAGLTILLLALLAGCTGRQNPGDYRDPGTNAPSWSGPVGRPSAAAPGAVVLAWSQPDACAGWEVRARQADGSWVVVTNIPRPLYGDRFTNTIASPHDGLHGIWAYTR